MATRSAWIEAWEHDAVPTAAARRSAARVTARGNASRYYGREATARLPQPAPELETRPLAKPRLVSKRLPRWPLIFAALAFAALLVGVSVVSPMLLTSGVTAVESQVGRVEGEQAQLSASLAALSSEISALSAPDRVAEQAAQLGLEPAEKVHYLESNTVGTESSTLGTEGDTTVAGR